MQLWRQRIWTNNKGNIAISEVGVRVFAFEEQPVPGTPYRVVLPESIRELPAAGVECLDTPAPDAHMQRIRVHGMGAVDVPGNRVLVVQQYRTPEMDYFSERALPFLRVKRVTSQQVIPLKKSGSTRVTRPGGARGAGMGLN